MELGFRIPIVSEIPRSLCCILDSKAPHSGREGGGRGRGDGAQKGSVFTACPNLEKTGVWLHFLKNKLLNILDNQIPPDEEHSRSA